MLYTNITTATAIFPDRDTNFFEVEAGILQGDNTLAPFLLIIVLDYVLHNSLDSIEEKGFLQKLHDSNQHYAQYLTGIDFADDLALIYH